MLTQNEIGIADKVSEVIFDLCDLYEISERRLCELLGIFFTAKAKELKAVNDTVKHLPETKPWMSQKGFKEYFNNL